MFRGSGVTGLKGIEPKSIDMILRFNEIREKANEEYKKNIKNNIENFLENK